MIKSATSVFFLAGISAVLSLSGCTNSSDSSKKAAAQPAAAAPVQKKAPVEDHRNDVPSATERDMALRMGNQLLMQGELEKAASKLEIAAAGGSSEAEKLLAKVRLEIEAKKNITSAKEKMNTGDFEGAKRDLARIPQTSSLRNLADRMAEKIDEKSGSFQNALEAGLQKGLQQMEKDIENDNAAPAEEPAEEEKAEEEPAKEEEPAGEEKAEEASEAAE